LEQKAKLRPLVVGRTANEPKRQGFAARFYAPSYTAKIVKIAKIRRDKANLALLRAIFMRASVVGDFILGER
jgi:hypothetical protein